VIASDAIDAADALLKGVYGLAPLAKATPNPLKPKGFDAIVLGALNALKKAARPGEQRALKAMLGSLERRWVGLTEAQQTKAIDAAAARYLTVARDVAADVTPLIQKQTAAVIFATKGAAEQAFKLKIHPTLDAADHQAVAFAASSQGNFIRNQYGARAAALSQVARDVVAKGVEDGLDRFAIGEALAARLNQTDAQRSDGYWRLIASVFVARARTYSTLKSFDEAGIASYQFEAVLDEETSEICRFMHRKVFPVASALKRFHDVEQAEDPESVKDLQPWAGTAKTPDGDVMLYYKEGETRHPIARVDSAGYGKKDEVGTYSHALTNEQMANAGMSAPPLHGHCRSILIPFFE
jgi:hypothetical protein